MVFINYNVQGTSIRSYVNLVKIESAVTFERVSELSPNFFLGISESYPLCTIFKNLLYVLNGQTVYSSSPSSGSNMAPTEFICFTVKHMECRR
jgi:hypothetical protein